MRKLVLAGIFLLIPIIAFSQAFPGYKIEWDYVDQDFISFGINRFEVYIDSVAQPNVPNSPSRQAGGLNTYQYPLPIDLKPGNHRVEVTACNAGGCSVPFSLDFVLIGTAPSPRNIRIVPPSPE